MIPEQHTPYLPDQDPGTTPMTKYIDVTVDYSSPVAVVIRAIEREIAEVPDPSTEEVDKITTELIGSENRQLFERFLKP